MGRTYRRKTYRGKYGPGALQAALHAVEGGAALLTSAKKFGVPARTLRRHRDGKVSSPGSIRLGRYGPDIERFEEQLTGYIKEMEQALFGLNTKDVRRLAFELATREGITHRFNCEKQMAGLDWLHGYLRRHPDLAIRKPQATSMSRATAFNRPQVEQFFEIYEEQLKKCVCVCGGGGVNVYPCYRTQTKRA